MNELIHPLTYNRLVGVFTENGPHGKKRLDIGGASVSQVRSDHESNLTRLKIKRLNGGGSEDISDEDLVGIFSEDGKYRLDIGQCKEGKKTQPEDHESWATLLEIRRLDGDSVGPVRQNHVVGFFSKDGKFRLDIGAGSFNKNTPADHNTWATRLRVKEPDPIEDIEIKDIDYRFKEATRGKPQPTDGIAMENDNDTGKTQVIHGKVSATVQETFGWSDTLGLKYGVKTTLKGGIPLVVDGEVEFSWEVDAQFTWNGSTSRTKTWERDLDLKTPPGKWYAVRMQGLVAEVSMPYTLNVIFIYKSGRREPGKVEGTYKGKNSYSMKAYYYEKDRATGDLLPLKGIEPIKATTCRIG